MDRFSYQIYRHSCQLGLVHAGDRIIVSLSGGIDSMSLYCLLADFREKIDLDLHLVHFNHGLRPESDAEADFLSSFADQQGCPITVIRADHLMGGTDVQNRARKWRYRELERVFEETGFDKIALGHHLDDLIETQIWRMLRGGSLFSFNPMRDRSPPYIRPLLRTPKAELERYLRLRGQNWCEDASNLKDDYTRNLIRHELIPLMERCSGGERFPSKMLALNSDAAQLRQLFDERVPAAWYQTDAIAYQTIRDLPNLFALELIHRFLLHHGQEEINRDNLERIHRLVIDNRGNWRLNLKNGIDIRGADRSIRLLERD